MLSLDKLEKFTPAAAMAYAPKWLREATERGNQRILNPFFTALTDDDLKQWIGSMDTAWKTIKQYSPGLKPLQDFSYVLLGYSEEDRQYLVSIGFPVAHLFDGADSKAPKLEFQARLFSFNELGASSKERPGSERWWAATLAEPRTVLLPRLKSTQTFVGNDNLKHHDPRIVKYRSMEITGRRSVRLT